jgi:hypothetical protein
MNSRRIRALPVIGLAGLLSTTIVLAIVLGVRHPGSDGRTVSAPGHVSQAADSNLRTLLVSATGPITESPAAGPLQSSFLDGTMPVQRTNATVLSDENCAPDANGLSHCLNRLRLADGTTLSVRHLHNMAQVPCLTVGEEVLVQPA